MEHILGTGAEQQRLRLLQLIANDTPSAAVDTEDWFCVLLLRLPELPIPGDAPGALGQYEPLMEDIINALSISALAVQYGTEYVVLLSGQRQALLEHYRTTLSAFLEALEQKGLTPLCYVSSPPVGGINWIPRAYRIAKTELEQRLFCKETPRILLPPETVEGGKEPLSSVGKDTERRLFLKLVNMDFDGAAICASELFSTIGDAGSSDIPLLKLRLFCLLENAAYFLAFRAGKDHSMSDIMPHYLGEFLSAPDADGLSRQMLLFIQMLEQNFSPSDSSVSLLINKMLGYFSDNYMDSRLTVASAAAHFYMSPQQLARDFKKLVGVSPSNYLTQIRLDRAKQLLLDTSMSNEQIANHVGFGSVKRLYRALQNSDGISPGQFRKNRGTIISESDS